MTCAACHRLGAALWLGACLLIGSPRPAVAAAEPAPAPDAAPVPEATPAPAAPPAGPPRAPTRAPARRPFVYLTAGLGGLVAVAHPGAAAFFDTAALLYEHAKNGPDRIVFRASGRLAWVAHPQVDVLVEGGYWVDWLRGDHETVAAGEFGAGARYAPWRWGPSGLGFGASLGAVFPRWRIEGQSTGRPTVYGRLAVDYQAEARYVVARVFVDYTLVAHEHAFPGALAHPLGGLGFGFAIGFGIPRR